MARSLSALCQINSPRGTCRKSTTNSEAEGHLRKTKMTETKIEDPIAQLITDYNELNSPLIEELDEEPSALEFMRFVAKNTPFVVRGAALDWQATKTWTIDYLKNFLGNEPVNVAVTPAGYAFLGTHPTSTPFT